MAKKTLWKSNKNCGNCVYWCGDRNIEPIRKCIIVETGTKGKCSAGYGIMAEHAACNKHELHPACK